MNHNNALKLLREFKAIADSVGLNYMLYGGTCLGAIREGSFIECDEDVDFACKQEEFEKCYKNLGATLLENGFEIELLDHRHSRPWGFRPFGYKIHKYGINCDLGAWFLLGDRRWIPSHKLAFCLVHTAKYFDDFKVIRFYGEDFKVPMQVSEFLTEKYGDWRTKHESFDNVCESTCRKEVQERDDFWWV